MASATARMQVNELRAMAPSGEQYLGAGRVTAVGAGSLTVELEDGAEVEATMALAFPYRAAMGDVLLVIGRRDRSVSAEGRTARTSDRHYVIGVLAGKGETDLRFTGDV